MRYGESQRGKIDKEAVCVGEKYHFELKIDLAGLNPGDIGAELVIAQQIVGGQNVNVLRTIPFAQSTVEGELATYTLDYTPNETGTCDFALRVFPQNPHLPHRMDFALVKWA